MLAPSNARNFSCQFEIILMAVRHIDLSKPIDQSKRVLRWPVTALIRSAGPGPIPRTVTVPGSTSVCPASAMSSATRPSSCAVCCSSLSSASPFFSLSALTFGSSDFGGLVLDARAIFLVPISRQNGSAGFGGVEACEASIQASVAWPHCAAVLPVICQQLKLW